MTYQFKVQTLHWVITLPWTRKNFEISKFLQNLLSTQKIQDWQICKRFLILVFQSGNCVNRWQVCVDYHILVFECGNFVYKRYIESNLVHKCDNDIVMRKTLQFAFYKMIEMFINVSTYIALETCYPSDRSKANTLSGYTQQWQHPYQKCVQM